MARSLLPREHGSYFQLAIPLGAVWARSAASAAGIALTIAAVGAFLAVEPLSVAIGGRGARMRTTEGRRARLRFVALALPSLGCGAFGLARAPVSTAIVAAVLGIITLGVIALVARRAVHTLLGELLAMVGLTGASAVVATAAGVALVPAVERWAAWILGFIATIVTVHQVLARRVHTGRRISAFPIGVVVFTGLLVGLAAFIPASLVAIPLTSAAVAIGIVAPSVRHIRAVGVAVAVAAVVSATLPW